MSENKTDQQAAPEKELSVADKIMLKKQKGGFFTKRKVIVAALLLVGFVFAVGMNDKNKDAKNVKLKTNEVDTGQQYENANAEQIANAKKIDELRAAAASEAGGSHVDKLQPQAASAVQGDIFANENQPTVAAASVPNKSSLDANAGNLASGNIQGQPQTRNVVLETVEKEIPVIIKAEYDWRKDPSLINYFANGKPLNNGGEQINQGGGQQNGDNGGVGQSDFAFNKAYQEKQKAQQEAANQAMQQSNQQAQGQGGNFQQVNSDTPAQIAPNVSLVRVGDLPPALLLTPIVSTHNSHVRAKIFGGVLNGGIVTGGFEQTDTAIAIKFNRLTLPNVPHSIEIEAVALDYETASTALATSVNRHIPERFLGELVKEFGNSFANSLAENNSNANSRTIVNENTGAVTQIVEATTQRKTTREIVREATANSVRSGTEVLLENIPKKPTVKVKGDLPLGVYFLKDVVIDGETAKLLNRQPIYK